MRKTISVRVPDQLFKKVERLAKFDVTSLSQVVNSILNRHFREAAQTRRERKKELAGQQELPFKHDNYHRLIGD